MNNINSIITFKYPLLLLLLIPSIIFALYFYFKLPKNRRLNRNRIVSMVLHIIVLVLITLVFSGISYNEEYISEKNDVIILVDSSDSNSHNEVEINNFIQEIISESSDKHKIGIVTFANDNIYASSLSTNKKNVYDDYINSSVKPDVTATNISTALLYSRDLLDNPMNGRIVLLTDGLDTEGNVVNVAKSIASTGTRIDTAFFSPVTNNEEVKIESIEIDGTVGLDKEVNINVTVKSNRASTAKVTLYDNDELLHEQTLTLENGETIISVPNTFITADLHALKAEIECDRDTLEQNNVVYSFVNISSLNNVLIVDGTGYESNNLSQLIRNDYNLTVVSINDVPTTIEALKEYEEVILVNVTETQLSANGFDILLNKFVYDFGGGMLVVSGDKTFSDDIEGTLYEDMMPVELNSEPNPLSLMVVVDSSSSMGNNKVPNTTKSYMDVAKEGVLASSQVLKSSDYMGIVSFDANAKLSLGLTPSTRTSTILSAINTLQPGYGTAYTQAINLAALELSNASSNSKKHILFITDGAPMDDGYVEAIEALNSDITLSIVVIGESWELNMDAVEEMVEVGGGTLYQSINGSDLSAIMAEDTKVAINEKINIGNVDILIEDYSSSAVSGIPSIPSLSGYYGGVKTKRKANTVLSYQGNPIYSDWSYGNGRVGAIMTDLNGDFSSEFYTDNYGVMFMENVIKSLLPSLSTSASDITVDFNTINQMTSIGITNRYEDYKLEVSVISPSGTITKLSLEQQTASYYGTNYTMSEAGIYTLNIKRLDSNGSTVSEVNEYQSYSYSEEYNGFYNESICYNLTRDIAMNAGGELLTNLDGMFDLESQVIQETHDLRVVLMSIAVVCFLLDIASRKFKFKLPSDFRNKQEIR